MKKRFLVLLLALFVLPCAFIFTGCGKMNRYISCVPDDQAYSATLHYTAVSSALETDRPYNFEYNISVVKKTTTVDGQEKMVIYLDYTWTDHTDASESHYKLLFVQGGNDSYRLNGENWEKEGALPNWNDCYVDVFVSYMTYARGFDFPEKYKTKETKDYIEYKFKNDEETFKISNDAYHVLLGYHMKSKWGEYNQTATLTLGESNFAIPYINTLHLDD